MNDDLDKYSDLEQEVTQEDEEMGPQALPSPTDWMNMSIHEWGESLDSLRIWVAAMTTEWALPTSVVLPCWEQHPDQVQLWSAVRDAYETLHHEIQPGTGPIDFQRYFSWARSELATLTGLVRCTASEHYAPRIQAWAQEIAAEGESSREFSARSARVDMAVQNHIAAGRDTRGMNVVFVDFSRGGSR